MITFKRALLASAMSIALSGLTACGGSSSSSNPTPAPTPTNSAPTDLALSASTVNENVVGATIGDLTVTDSDSNETHTFAVDDARFEVSGSSLKLKADQQLDFETDPTVTVKVTVTDKGNATYSEDFEITVVDTVDVPATYAYESRFSATSSVSYPGQSARMVLIQDMFIYIASQLKNDVDNNVITSKADAVNKLLSFYDIPQALWDNTVADRQLLLATTPAAKQQSVGAVSSSRKDLLGKIAGSDVEGQHKDWTTDFAGWNATGSTTPDGLVRTFIDMIGDNVQTYIDGNLRTDPNGLTINELYVTTNGLDLRQLLQKFLLGSVAFSQAADDYLDDDFAGKGLLADNTQGAKDGTQPYTALEHAFDEGFGYFGAARNYADYNDNEIAGKVASDADGRADWNGYHDTDADNAIDFLSEYNFGASVNAAKRDRGATVATDFTKKAFDAFVTGRAIINQADGALTDQQMTDLKAQRDIALEYWEKAISATTVHYINDTIADIEKIGTADYSFADAAKHWSEMKGFALSIQFNRHSPVTDAQYDELHQLIGMQSVLTTDDVAAYKANLLEARTLLQNAYGFDQQNVENW